MSFRGALFHIEISTIVALSYTRAQTVIVLDVLHLLPIFYLIQSGRDRPDVATWEVVWIIRVLGKATWEGCIRRWKILLLIVCLERYLGLVLILWFLLYNLIVLLQIIYLIYLLVLLYPILRFHYLVSVIKCIFFLLKHLLLLTFS